MGGHSQGCTEGSLLCPPQEEGELRDNTHGPQFIPELPVETQCGRRAELEPRSQASAEHGCGLSEELAGEPGAAANLAQLRRQPQSQATQAVGSGYKTDPAGRSPRGRAGLGRKHHR